MRFVKIEDTQDGADHKLAYANLDNVDVVQVRDGRATFCFANGGEMIVEFSTQAELERLLK